VIQDAVQPVNAKGSHKMEKPIAVYHIIWSALLVGLVVTILVVATQASAQTGPPIFDAIEAVCLPV
jgi:cytochrome c oxidase subunit IV